ncbi:MAG: tail fiber domain-containing protein, partial [Patescibacteria group bacterium]|nr:tail fiber domain-containing protein [Patescibacteria group bacterium]
GIQGLTGLQGIQGDPGLIGLTGPEGPQGIQGLTGLQGIQGDPGLIGLTGPEGPQGIQGLTGLQGIQGDPGLIGLTGPEGPQGIQGLTGLQGIQGDPGLIGLTGPEGPQGPVGSEFWDGVIDGDIYSVNAGNVGMDGDLIVSGGDIKTDVDNVLPSLHLDSTGSGDNWTSQGAYIVLGELAGTSGYAGAAALYMTYRGDGYGFIGSGAVINAEPGASYLRFDYNSDNIYTPDALTIGGRSYQRSMHITQNADRDTTAYSVITSTPNLHLDSKEGYGIYLNWYGGANGTYFGNGGSSQVGRIDGSGNLSISGDLTVSGGDIKGGSSGSRLNLYAGTSYLDGAFIEMYGQTASPNYGGIDMSIDADGTGTQVFNIKQINGSASTVLLSASEGGTVRIHQNSVGTGLQIGDDAYIGDIDQAAKIGIRGTGGNAANGGIVFGSAEDTNIFRNAANTLRTNDSLIVDGNVTASGFYYSSDRRLKKDIKSLDFSSISKILELNPVEFRWKESNELSLGFIAQDLEKIYPELVNTDNSEQGMKSINYAGIIAPLVKTIQEQQLMIEEQDQKINKLEDLYNKQQERIDLIEEGLYEK